MNEDRLARFAEVYRAHLAAAVVSHPEEYAWPIENVPTVADKMIDAVRRDSFSKDGRAMRATFKALGVKHTYTALREWLGASA